MIQARAAVTQKSRRLPALALGALAALAVFALIAVSPASAGSGGLAIEEEEVAGTDGGKQKSSGQSEKSKSKYQRRWNRVSNRNKRWARRTSDCESGGDPKAIGGGGLYRGAFQFHKSTWRAAPKSPGGDPIKYNYKTQAVVAVALKRSDGAHHWPNCG